MEDALEIGKVVGQEDVESFGTLMDTTEDEMDEIYGKLAVGNSRLPRVLIDKRQATSRLPEATQPQFPELEIDEAP